MRISQDKATKSKWARVSSSTAFETFVGTLTRIRRVGSFDLLRDGLTLSYRSVLELPSDTDPSQRKVWMFPALWAPCLNGSDETTLPLDGSSDESSSRISADVSSTMLASVKLEEVNRRGGITPVLLWEPVERLEKLSRRRSTPSMSW